MSPLFLVVIIIYPIVFLLGIIGITVFQGKTMLLKAFQVPSPLLPIIILGGGSGLMVIILSIISGRLFRIVRNLEEEFRMILGKLTLIEIVVIAIISSVAEETFFRGALQPLVGLEVTSFIFGILHFPINQKYLVWTIFALGMGFLLGWLYQATSTLLTPIITHALVNLVNLWRIFGRPEKST